MNKPNENETVWFRVDDGKEVINCMVNDLTGWRLGWWSGSRWHSYHDKEINEADVIEWKSLGI